MRSVARPRLTTVRPVTLHLLATLATIEKEVRLERAFDEAHPEISGRYLQVARFKVRCLEEAARTIRAYLLPPPAA